MTGFIFNAEQRQVWNHLGDSAYGLAARSPVMSSVLLPTSD
jgi:hypothetical protein